jgi:hypothetical protein
MRKGRKGYWLASVFALILWAALGAGTARAQDKFGIGAQLAVDRLTELGETPVGYGFRFSYGAYPPFVSLEGEMNRFPTNATGNLGETQIFLGAKLGVTVHKWGVFAKLRPGFANFGGGGASGRLSGATFFALDVGGVVEYHVVPHLALRVDVGGVATHFGSATLAAGPGGPIGTRLGTRENLQTTFGIMVGF